MFELSFPSASRTSNVANMLDLRICATGNALYVSAFELCHAHRTYQAVAFGGSQLAPCEDADTFISSFSLLTTVLFQCKQVPCSHLGAASASPLHPARRCLNVCDIGVDPKPLAGVAAQRCRGE